MAHIWYEGTSHRYTSPGTKIKVICKGQGQISGSCFSTDGCFGGISVSQTHLVILFLFSIFCRTLIPSARVINQPPGNETQILMHMLCKADLKCQNILLLEDYVKNCLLQYSNEITLPEMGAYQYICGYGPQCLCKTDSIDRKACSCKRRLKVCF